MRPALVVRLISIPLLLIGFLLIRSSFLEHQQNRNLKKTGVKTDAVIVDRVVTYRETREERNGRSTTRNVRVVTAIYEFKSADGAMHRFRGEGNSSRKDIGSRWDLYYNPQHPDAEYMVADDSWSAYINYVGGGVCLLLGIVAFWAGGKI